MDLLLKGKRIGFFVEIEYHDLELWYPKMRFEEEGAECPLIGTGSAKSYKGKIGVVAPVDMTAAQVNPCDFDAFVFTGGFAPIRLRVAPDVLAVTRAAYEQGKVIATICFGGWMLASADIVRGKRVSCHEALTVDLKNSGAIASDTIPHQVDGNIVTARYLRDMYGFTRSIIDLLTAKG